MSTNIVTDQSKNILWNARRGDDQSLLINARHNNDAFDLSGETFTLLLLRFGGGAVITLTQGNGLINGGIAGTLAIAFTDSQLEIQADTYLIFLKSINGSGRVLTWLNGTFVLNGEQWDGTATDEETIEINTGSTILNLTITLAGGTGGSSEVTDYEDFETDGFPTSPGDGQEYLLIFNDEDAEVDIAGVKYYHHTIIKYHGSGNWLSWPANFGADS